MAKTQTRPGFARLLPLMALAGPAAATIGLLASARPVQAPHASVICCNPPVVECWKPPVYPSPVPRSGIRDAHGQVWSLADLKPGAVLEGANLRGARWRGVALEGVALRRC